MEMYVGFLAEGNDIESGTYTMEAAQEYASMLPGCVGFCFQGPADDGNEYECFFKNRWEYCQAEGWTSVRVTRGEEEESEEECTQEPPRGEQDPLLDAAEEDSEEECTQEPCCLQPFIATTSIFDGPTMQSRPDLEMGEMGAGYTENILGNFKCTQAIQQSFCGCCTFGQFCCTHRSEFTHSLTLTSKRVQISMDEAEGCWPSMDEDNPSSGNPICGCCCLAPSGCIQTKTLALLDIAGYAREKAVPKVQILSSFRFALSFWAFLVVGTFACAVLMTEEGQAAADVASYHAMQATEMASATASAALVSANQTSNSIESWTTVQPAPDSSTVSTVLMGFALIVVLATIFYVLIDQVLKYGWKFVALCTLLLAPLAVLAFMNIDLVFEHLMSEDLSRQVAPYYCLTEVFAKAGIAAASLPLWLLLAWMYIALFGVRQYKIRLNFANQVSYTITMRRKDVDKVSEILAEQLNGEGNIIPAVDVEGAGWFDENTDMPITLPGQELHTVRYESGGGLKLTNVALATHSEQYSFLFFGPEIYQLSEVYIHSPVIKASLLTRMEHTTNLMPRMMRRLFYFVGALLLALGITFAIRDFTASNPEAPFYYSNGHPRLGVALSVFAIFIIAFPKITGCCVSTLVLDFTWGTISLFLTLSSDDAEKVMKWIVHASCRPDVYVKPNEPLEEEELSDPFNEVEAQSCLSPMRVLQITDLRIKIMDDKTSISYMRSGLTECDMGPEEWHERCFGLCPITGWSRPNRDSYASLSLNFGWLKGLPQDSFPGTNLAVTERMMFTYQDCMEICKTLDQPFGEFVHHMWTPIVIEKEHGDGV